VGKLGWSGDYELNDERTRGLYVMSEADWHWEMKDGRMVKVTHKKPKASMPNGQTYLGVFK